MTTAARRTALGPGSDPPSGVRSHCTAADLGAFAQQQLKHPGRWVRELGVPRQDVEDLLQETFVVMVEKAGTIHPEALKSWFRSALRNKKLHFVRARAVAARFEPLLQAHLDHGGSSFAAPDADLVRQQAISAVFWLVDQVHESRREVAERHLLDDEPLPQMAGATGVPSGTVFARWQHAKEDMREAIERERKKQGSRRWLVLLAALVETLWLLFLAKGRRFTGALAELGERAAGRLRRPREMHLAIARSPDRSDRRRSRAGALGACALLPLAVLSHVPLDLRPPPAALVADAFGAMAGFESSDTRPDTGEERDAEPGRLTPSPITTAERILERKPIVLARAGKPHAAPTAKTPDPDAANSADLDMARNLLLRATTSYEQGNDAIAGAALKQYRRMFPENPYPALHERAAKVEHSR